MYNLHKYYNIYILKKRKVKFVDFIIEKEKDIRCL